MTNNEKKIKYLTEQLNIVKNINYLYTKQFKEKLLYIEQLEAENIRLQTELDQALKKLDNDY